MDSIESLYKIANDIGLHIDGIFSMYYIPKTLNLKKKNLNLIILISPSRFNVNGHWVCLKRFDDNVLYFDSFGMPPPNEIYYLFPKLKWHYNNFQIQAINQSNCGKFCIDLLYHLNNYKNNLPTILKEFNNFINNFHIYNIYK